MAHKSQKLGQLVFSFYLLEVVYYHGHFGQNENTAAEDIIGFVSYSRFVA